MQTKDTVHPGDLSNVLFLLAEFTQLLFLATAGWRVGGLLSSEAPPTPPPLFTAESPCQPPLAGVTEFPVGGASSGAEEC